MSRGAHPIQLPPELAESPARITELLQADELDEVAIGVELCAVHRCLLYSNFVAWIESELAITHGKAVRYMAAAARAQGR